MTAGTGPSWTRARLLRVMKLRYGTTRRGSVDIAAAAAELGVSERTVRRWLAGHSGRALAHIPPRRLDQLLKLLQPSDEQLRDEAQQLRQAENFLRLLDDPRPGWVTQHWLEPHLVVILRPNQETMLRQIAFGRLSAGAAQTLAKRGRILHSLEVPTRIHAIIVTQRVLLTVGPWRYRAGPRVKTGNTQVWLDDAPTIKLTAHTNP